MPDNERQPRPDEHARRNRRSPVGKHVTTVKQSQSKVGHAANAVSVSETRCRTAHPK